MKRLDVNLAGKKRLSHNPPGFLMCHKSKTRDPLLYFPSEGRHAEDFYARKNPTASAGFEPAILGTRGQHANHQTTKAAEHGIWTLKHVG
jgi:hypothetical protein